jgi:tetratricopeptide (TPR) repeat protein
MATRCAFAIAALASLFVCGEAGAAPALADAAQDLFERGKALVDARDYEEACPLFAESYALDPNVGVLLNLAYCYEGAHRATSAWRIWIAAANAADARGEPARAAFARERARDLEADLLRATIAVTSQAAAGVEVRIDGAPLAQERWGTEIPLDEGEHEIEAGGEGLRPWSSRFFVEPGRAPALVTVPELVPTGPPPAERAPPPDRGAPSERGTPVLRTVAWTAFGAGLAALAVGAGFGIAGLVTENTATQDRDCVSTRGSRNCNPAGMDDLALERRDMRVAEASYALGGGLLVTAAAMWLLSRGAPARSTRAARVVVAPAWARGAGRMVLSGTW